MSARIDSSTRVGRTRWVGTRSDAGPALWIRAGVLLQRGRLDWALARGADPDGSPLLRARADQLVEPRMRASVADQLERLLQEAGAPRSGGVSASVPLERDAIIEARDALVGLVAALRTTAHPAPRGVALVRRLLTDGAGPLYASQPVGALWREAWNATAALEDARSAD